MSTYNDAATLAASIESVLGQDFADFEFIIVNDGSPDPRTAEILTDYARRDGRVRVIAKANEGLTKALIDGCAAARGQYIARIDVGDVMTPDRLRRQAEVLDRYPEVVFVSCWTEYCGPEWELLWVEKGQGRSQTSEVGSRQSDPTRGTNPRQETHASVDRASVGSASVGSASVGGDAGSPRRSAPPTLLTSDLRPPVSMTFPQVPGFIPHPSAATDLRPPTSDLWLGNILPDTPGGNLKAGPTHHGSVLMRADAYRRAGGYRWQFYYGQDWDLWYRHAEQGRFAMVSDVLYRVRLFPASISALNSARQVAIGRCSLEAFTLHRQGRDESPALHRAAAIRPGAGARRPATRFQRAGGWYFIGAALLRNCDPRCRGYFREALNVCPYHLRAWTALLLAALPGRRLDHGGAPAEAPR